MKVHHDLMGASGTCMPLLRSPTLDVQVHMTRATAAQWGHMSGQLKLDF